MVRRIIKAAAAIKKVKRFIHIIQSPHSCPEFHTLVKGCFWRRAFCYRYPRFATGIRELASQPSLHTIITLLSVLSARIREDMGGLHCITTRRAINCPFHVNKFSNNEELEHGSCFRRYFWNDCSSYSSIVEKLPYCRLL